MFVNVVFIMPISSAIVESLFRWQTSALNSCLPAGSQRRLGKFAILGQPNTFLSLKDFTPTYRGFDTFFGYYAAALGDYWYHGNPGGGHCKNVPPKFSTDLSNSTGAAVAPADAPGVNGTYDEALFTAEAVRHIGAAEAAKGLYVYLAYQNVHSTAQNAANGLCGTHSIQAPCSTIDAHYATTALDTYKAHGGALTALDYGVGNVTVALDAAARPYLIAFVADNGGPLPHSTNAPYRGGKHTLWDGGLRVVGWVSGPLVPAARHGAKWGGLAHSSDWYASLVEGVAGGTLPAHTGPRAPDIHNLWPALLSGGASPRTEVAHQVVNAHTAAEGLHDPAVLRTGRYKLIAPSDPEFFGAGDYRIVAWPEPAPAPVPFGLSNGSRNGYPEDVDACRAPVLDRCGGECPSPPKGPAGRTARRAASSTSRRTSSSPSTSSATPRSRTWWRA
jgi:arylsulfatase A-like enzyme